MGNATFRSFQEALRLDYGDKALPMDISDYLIRCIYPILIPDGFQDSGNTKSPIYTRMGLQIATGYNRIFYSDYGPYLELDKDQIIRTAIQQSTGNSLDTNSNVETYLNYKSNDGLVNVRLQLKQTGVRSFEKQKFYINIFDVSLGKLLPVEGTQDFLSLDNAFICQAVSCRGKYNDNISHEVSRRWPFVVEEYESLCSMVDTLSLLGSYQVITTNEAGTEGIVNLFCNMATDRNRRHAGMNPDAMVNAIYDLACDVPGQHIVIPYGTGCENDAEWESMHRKLSCRLQGKNVSILKYEPAQKAPEATSERTLVGGTYKPPETESESPAPIQTPAEAESRKENPPEPKEAVLLQIVQKLEGMSEEKLLALLSFLSAP